MGSAARVVETRKFHGPVDLQPTQAGIAHDGEQPGPRLAAQSVEETVSAQHGLLHHVLGVVIVARQPARKVVRRVQMRQHAFLESLLAFAQGFIHGTESIGAMIARRLMP